MNELIRCSNARASALGACLPPLRERHRGDQQQAEGNLLDEGVEAQQVHAVVEYADQDDGEECAHDGALTTGGGCAAQVDGGDGLQFEAVAVDRVTGGRAGCQQHTGQPGDAARKHVHQNAYPRQVDTGQAGGGRIAAEGIDRPPQNLCSA